MPGSIRATVGSGSLQVFSEIEWAAVHNDGGTAGHGAKIPQRTFLDLEEDDLEVLESFILDEVEELMNKS
jgi:phage gpG-like protein